jgi:hypothetical protein
LRALLKGMIRSNHIKGGTVEKRRAIWVSLEKADTINLRKLLR